MKKVLLVLFTSMAAMHGSSQWSWNSSPTVNNSICSASATTQKTGLVAAPDGSGGMFVAWEDSRTLGNGTDIYIQRIDAGGNLMFDANGLAVCNALEDQSNIAMTDDGAGGVILTWQDARGGNNNIYAQKVSAVGALVWTLNGTPIIATAASQTNPSIARVNATETVVLWRDDRNGNIDLFAQKISNGTGALLWGTETTVVAVTGTQTGQSIIPDGMGGVFIVWEDPRIATGNREIFVQRINNSGVVQWTANGVNGVNVSDPTNTYSGTQITPQIAPDGMGGIYVCWNDQRLGAADANIYAQRVDGNGATQWTSGGLVVTAAQNVQSNPRMINDGGTNAIICWGDNRESTTNRDFYAQKIDLTGTAVWPTANGVAISRAAGNQPNNVTSSAGFNVVSDGAGGAIFVWDDARNTNTNLNIMGQRISSAGMVQWTEDGNSDGRPVSTASGNQRNPVSVSDNNGGAIVAWSDSRTSTNGEIYGSRLFAPGTLPVEFITITAAQNKDLVAIAWKATCDNMTDRFVIEKSSDSRQFSSIGSVQANIVNGKCVADFAFNDVNLLNGTNYYRIKGIDKDGKFTYSTIAKVTVNAKGVVVHLSPNPVRDVANVRLTNFNKGNYQLRIADATGKIVQASTVNVQLPFQQQSLSIGSLNSGTYILNVIDAKGNMITSTRFIKQ